MGHLINPIAFRLGWSVNWVDSWFLDFLYYPEFLYFIYRIRFFLIYFFSLEFFEKSGYFYSHVEIKQQYNNILINIFFYDSFTENFYEDFLIEHLNSWKSLNLSLRTKKFKPLYFFNSWKLIILFSLITTFEFDNMSIEKIYLLIYAINLLNKVTLYEFFKTANKNISLEYIRYSKSMLYSFYFLYYTSRIILKRIFYKKKLNINIFVSRFIYSFTWAYWNYFLFLHFKYFLIYIFNLFFSFNNLIIHFLAINSYTINAKFLSRYIAKKLKQGYSLFELLNPIKNELRLILKVLSISKTEYSLNFDKLRLINNKSKKLHFNSLNFSISLLLSLYERFFSKFYFLFKTWILFDYFYLIFNLNINLNILLIYILFSFFKNLFIFRFFFSEIRVKKLLNFFFIPTNSVISLNSSLNFTNYFELIYDQLFINYNMLYFTNTSILQKSFLYSNLHLSNFIRYTYWHFDYKNFLLKSNINKSKKKFVDSLSLSHLLGFKLHCLGRFARKQRAASLWYKEIKLPLSSIEAIIDYGNFAIPLKNSIVNIKFWLYLNKNFMKFYFKVI